MLITALVIALLLRTYMLVAVYAPVRLRDSVDTVMHGLAIALALLAVPVLDVSIRTALAAAFVADFAVHLREFLDVVGDLCKTLILSRERRR